MSIMLLSSCVDFKQGDFQTAVAETVNDVLPLSEININGVWESKDNRLYPVLEFKGKSTALVHGGWWPISSHYVRDEEFIRIDTKVEFSDLVFEIISEDSIVGTGWTKGTWIRKK